jgi:hypothetical protein
VDPGCSRRVEYGSRDVAIREGKLLKWDKAGFLAWCLYVQGLTVREWFKGGAERADRIARVLHAIIAEMSEPFERNALNAEIVRLGLFADDDPI